MSIHYACVLPHPPLILPEIGRGEEHKIQHTIESYQTIANEIARIKPETIGIADGRALATKRLVLHYCLRKYK